MTQQYGHLRQSPRMGYNTNRLGWPRHHAVDRHVAQTPRRVVQMPSPNAPYSPHTISGPQLRPDQIHAHPNQVAGPRSGFMAQHPDLARHNLRLPPLVQPGQPHNYVAHNFRVPEQTIQNPIPRSPSPQRFPYIPPRIDSCMSLEEAVAEPDQNIPIGGLRNATPEEQTAFNIARMASHMAMASERPYWYSQTLAYDPVRDQERADAPPRSPDKVLNGIIFKDLPPPPFLGPKSDFIRWILEHETNEPRRSFQSWHVIKKAIDNASEDGKLHIVGSHSERDGDTFQWRAANVEITVKINKPDICTDRTSPDWYDPYLIFGYHPLCPNCQAGVCLNSE